jgi:hypothetical protein
MVWTRRCYSGNDAFGLILSGLNLAYEQPDYLSRIVEQASVARAMLKNTNLVSFEIGNEPGT